MNEQPEASHLVSYIDLGNYTHQDVTKAVAEIRRLQEMNERSLRHIHRHAIEIERLTEENTALRQAIQEATLQEISDIGQEIEWDTSDMAHRSGGLSVEQEPVAYKYTDKTNPLVFYFTTHKDSLPNPDVIETALYAAPPKLREKNNG